MHGGSRRWVGSAVAVVAAVAATFAPAAHALPAHEKALLDLLGPLTPTRRQTCQTCHAAPGEPRLNPNLPNPHNPFGARLAALKEALAARGKPNGITERLVAAAGEDTDGDGAANLVELLTGTSPGRAQDRPTRAELAAAPKLLSAFRKQQERYRWEPFATVRRPSVPTAAELGPLASWVRNPVDAFLARGYREHGLQPRAPASRETLLRRVYLDLTGLPPTRQELVDFLADTAPDAYERVVDRLLASPRYGERWGRHWMDVWRYSDWDGFGEEVRNSQRHIWRWRDWIVRSLNEDRGYDRMVQEMLAGDELAPTDPDILPATGFLVRNWYLFNREIALNNTVEGVSKAFLGITLNCARCHEHKYDPLSQQEYFAFRAFFQAHDIRMDRVPGQPDLVKDGLPRVYDAHRDRPTQVFLQGDERKPDPNQTVQPAVPAALGGPPVAITPVPLPLFAYAPDRQPWLIRETEAASAAEREKAVAAVSAARTMLETVTPAERAAAEQRLRSAELAAAEAAAAHEALTATLRAEALEDAGRKGTPEWETAARAAQAAQRTLALARARRQVEEAAAGVEKARAEAEARAQLVATRPTDPALQEASTKANMALAAAREKEKAAAEALSGATATLSAPAGTQYEPRPQRRFPEESTGRRLALARWITSPQNPLAARVAVNHIWLRHFGQPLVPTVFEFGRNGQRPANPALVDWLAAELMAGGWKMKAFHRLLVTSSAYRMDSTPEPRSLARDPDNRHFWRMNARRMEAEAVRDSVLHAAGQLDLTAGGPDLDPAQGLTVKRRSLYFRHSMEKQVEFLATFDQVPPSECYQRPESVMPQQALALANSSLALAQSRLLARDLWALVAERPEPRATHDFLTAAFQQVLGRLPTAAERAECLRFLEEQARRLGEPARLTPFTTGKAPEVAPAADPAQRAREGLIHALFNHHDFVTIH